MLHVTCPLHMWLLIGHIQCVSTMCVNMWSSLIFVMFTPWGRSVQLGEG